MATDARVLQGPPRERERAQPHDLLVAGAGMGVVAGAAMMAWMAVVMAIRDTSPSRPLALVGATLLGPDAADGGAGVLLAGGLLWVVVSAALAIPFSAIASRDFPFASAAIVGIGYSFVVMAIVTMVVLPLVNPLMRAEMRAAGGAWVLGYIIFGVGLGFIPGLRRRILAR